MNYRGMKRIVFILIILSIGFNLKAENRVEFSWEVYGDKVEQNTEHGTLYFSSGFIKSIGTELFIAYNSYYGAGIIGHQIMSENGLIVRIGGANLIMGKSPLIFLQGGYAFKNGFIATISRFQNNYESRSIFNIGVNFKIF